MTGPQLFSSLQDLPPSLGEALGELVELEQLDSTSDEALRRLRAGQAGNCLIVARTQSAGRGRRGHRWLSPPGAGLYFSLVREMPLELTDILPLGPVTALALRAGIADLGVHGLSVKWPNDLLVGNRKLGGVLIETHGDAPARHVVAGIGLNARFPAGLMKRIDQPAIDLASICDDDLDWPKLLPSILGRLLEYFGLYVEHRFAHFQQEWKEFDRYFEQDVVVQTGYRKHIGRVAGIDEAGALLVRGAAGLSRIVSGTIFPSRRDVGPKP